MQQQIATVNSTMEVFSQAKTSRKRKRHKISESECSEHEDTAMAENSTNISNEVDGLLQTAASKKRSKTDEYEVLGELTKFMTPKER